MAGTQHRVAKFFDEQIGTTQPAGQKLEQLVPGGSKIGLVHSAYALRLGQDIHIEVNNNGDECMKNLVTHAKSGSFITILSDTIDNAIKKATYYLDKELESK